jgi:hypothetical protein
VYVAKMVREVGDHPFLNARVEEVSLIHETTAGELTHAIIVSLVLFG